MADISALRGAPGERGPGAVPVRLRDPEPGDLGWVVERHGALYAAEQGWNAEFEGLVAEIVGRFAQRVDPARERCWIAERGGERAGCIFCVEKSATVAQLRMLLVEPWARGLGIGARLVDACMAFARAAGYRSMVLWTDSVLEDARRLYGTRGFTLVKSEPHHSFGHDLVGETWKARL
jgi:N-acetylglutamate synthase-like GNAT family acetyltransferase